MKRAIAALVLVASAGGFAQPKVDVAAALKTVTPDLAQRVARFKPVKMPYNPAALSQRERAMVDQLVDRASRTREHVLAAERSGSARTLQRARGRQDPARAERCGATSSSTAAASIWWTRTGHLSAPRRCRPGHALYPAGLTRADVEAYVARNPATQSPSSTTRTPSSRGPGRTGRTYRASGITASSPSSSGPPPRRCDKAADLSDDAAFARFLRLRADALLTDDYYNSDIAWVDLKNPKFDVIYAPYETYLDDLLGVKTSYGAVDPDPQRRREREARALSSGTSRTFRTRCRSRADDRPSVRGHATPMEVMDAPFRAGDLRHGYQAVADNLPNDPRIHQQKGTKKIFFKNFMDARVNEVILPLAARVMDPAQARQASADGYMASTLMHEICHGLGPAFARVGGRQTDIREAIGGLFGGLEEAKADVVGMHALKWLVDRDALPKARLEEYYASYVAGIFRTVRFGTGEAHGRAEMMEFNYLSEQGAIANVAGRYHVDYAKMPVALAALAKELLEQEATGNRARAEAWFARYNRMPPALTTVLAAAKDVPVDVDPIFSFAEPVR